MTSDKNLITSASQLEAVISSLDQMPFVALDTETTGLDPLSDRLLLLQIGDDNTQIVVDCRQVSLEPLRPFLTGNKPKVAHNAKFDYKFLAAAGIRLENMVDTFLIERILENGRGVNGYSLKALAGRYLNEELSKEERMTFENHSGQFTKSQLDYARRDVSVAYRIFLSQMPRLKKSGLARTAKLECLALTAFGDMELAGIHLDVKRWEKLVEQATKSRGEFKKKLDEQFAPYADKDLFGEIHLNYDSEEQVRLCLNKAGLELPDTSESSLRSSGHPAALALLDYREQQKIVSTYGETFLAHIHKETGRIHPQFHQLGADSGRVSCRDPNLQNIKAGSEFRECFTAPKGRRIVTADYSGCELRIIAQASGDPVFVETFKKGGDLHSIVATSMFGKTVSKKKNPELRRVAKAINFGLAYGMGPAGLAQQIGKSVEEARGLIDKYFQTYSRIGDYLEGSAKKALKTGYSETFLGRKRYYTLPDDPGSAEGRKEAGRIGRQAKNMPIQGTNADMIKLALTLLRKGIDEKNLDAQIVNMVHDEIVVECVKNQADETADLLKSSMVKAGERFIQAVPVEVDCSVGGHWEH